MSPPTVGVRLIANEEVVLLIVEARLLANEDVVLPIGEARPFVT
jgi:hypothetical protein